MADILFCENNTDDGIEDLIDKIDSELEGVTYEVTPCLGHCGDCAEGLFCLINGEFTQADTTDELFEKIKAELG